jgi:hypothetical protein
MTSFTWSADDVDSLTVTGNSQLATINFAGLADNGTSTAATANVQSNALVSTTTKNQYDAAPATLDRGSYVSVSGMATLKLWLTDALTATTQNIEVYFDTIELVQNQASATAAYADAVHTDSYASTEENAVAYSKTTAGSGRTTYQTKTAVFPLLRNAFGAVIDNAAGDGITLTNALGSYDAVAATGTTQTVAQLVAVLDGNANLGSGTKVTAARDSYNESLYEVSWTTTAGAAANASATGVVYFTYGTDPLTGKAIVGTTGNVTAGGVGHTKIAGLIATALNAATNAFVATATANKLLITATVSGSATFDEDRGPLSHALQTLAIPTTVATTTLLWAGEAEKAKSAAMSNVTAVASSLFNLVVTKVDRTGLRVTLRNNSTTTADAALAAVEKASADTMTGVGVYLSTVTDGANIISAALNSNTLDYTSAFSDVESPVAASTTTVNRTTWL